MMTPCRRLELCLALAFASLLASCGAAGRSVVASPPDTPATDVTATVASRPPDTEIGGGVERRVFDHALLETGARYRASGELQDIDVVFRGPSSPLYAATAPHYLGMSVDRQAVDTVVSILPIAGLRVFPSPDVDLTDLADDAVGAVTDDAPSDIVGWLAARPFVIASGIDEHLHIGHLVGRGFTYEVGDISEQARACGPAPTHPCAATILASGIAYHMAPGERGRVAQLDVGGQPVLVMVTDGPASDDILSSLRFEVRPVPDQAGDATRLPYFAPALEPGERYYIDKVGTDVGLVTTAPPTPVTASQRKDLAWFGDPTQSPTARHYYFVAFDAGTVAANEDPSLDPYALPGPTGIVYWELMRFLHRMRPLPDDPISWLSQQPYVQIEQPERDAQIGGRSARVIDVRAERLDDAIPCPDARGTCVMPFAHMDDAFPIVISSEYVTRVVDITVGTDHILIAADLGTPGEQLLDSVCAFALSAEQACG